MNLEIWNTTSFTPVARDSTHYYFHTTTEVNSLIKPGNSVRIFPNPFDSHIAITFPSQNIEQTIITLHNTLGQTVYHTEENNLTNRTKTIDLGYLSKGIYYLDVMMDGELVVKKIVKE